jgi:hypothetical protein
METAYKVFRRDTIETIRLRCVGFDFEPELTAKLLRAGRRIVEVPITYSPRRSDEGKKIRWTTVSMPCTSAFEMPLQSLEAAVECAASAES